MGLRTLPFFKTRKGWHVAGTGYDDSGGGYELPVASANTLGGVKIGENLEINSQGVLSASGGGGLSFTTTEQKIGKLGNDDLYSIFVTGSITDSGNFEVTIANARNNIFVVGACLINGNSITPAGSDYFKINGISANTGVISAYQNAINSGTYKFIVIYTK